MASLQISVKRVKKNTLNLLVFALLIGAAWFGGQWLSSYMQKNDVITYGDFSQYVNNKPVLYVAQGCPACKQAKDYISKHQIQVEIRVVNNDPQWIGDLQSLKISSVPVLVQEGSVTVGFSEPVYAALN